MVCFCCKPRVVAYLIFACVGANENLMGGDTLDPILCVMLQPYRMR